MRFCVDRFFAYLCTLNGREPCPKEKIRPMKGKCWRMCAVAAVAVVLAVSACNKKGEIFEQQMDTIRSWVESRNENGSAYTEIMSGVFRDIVYPEDGNSARGARRQSLSDV